MLDHGVRCPVPSHADVEGRLFLDIESATGARSSWGVLTKHVRLYECPACGTRYREPAPAEAVESFYEQSYHDEMAGIDEVRTRAYRAENEVRIAYLKRFVPTGRVLDIGCSTGQFAAQLRDAGFEAYGADISEDACRAATELLGADRVFHGRTDKYRDALRGRLNAITLMDVIEHFEDVHPPLEDMFQMLEPGGVLCMRTPTLSSPFYRAVDAAYRLSAKRLTGPVLKIYHAEHFYFFNERSIEMLLRETGWEVLDISSDPLLWQNFRTAEMRHGWLTNSALGGIYALGRLANRGHGMRVVARRPAR